MIDLEAVLDFLDIYLMQVEKQDKQWYFYVQMEGSSTESDKFETKIIVSKYSNSERHSVSYNGKVCPIDIKGKN